MRPDQEGGRSPVEAHGHEREAPAHAIDYKALETRPRPAFRRRARAPSRACCPASAPTTTKLVFLLTDPATLPPSRSMRAVASSRVMRSSVPVSTKVLPASGPPAGGRDAAGCVCHVDAGRAQPLDELAVVRLVEPTRAPTRRPPARSRASACSRSTGASISASIVRERARRAPAAALSPTCRMPERRRSGATGRSPCCARSARSASRPTLSRLARFSSLPLARRHRLERGDGRRSSR